MQESSTSTTQAQGNASQKSVKTSENGWRVHPAPNGRLAAGCECVKSWNKIALALRYSTSATKRKNGTTLIFECTQQFTVHLNVNSCLPCIVKIISSSSFCCSLHSKINRSPLITPAVPSILLVTYQRIFK